ncbi:MAG: hypothetical protein ACPG05_00960 [Bdellovibrionales bacterium]
MINKKTDKRSFSIKQQNGNVLFLILIAVALFAALSYAVTQSTRGGGNADDETALLNSTTVTQFGGTIASAIQRMMLFNGVDETELCFYTGNNHTDYNHAGCADNMNNIFHPDGGGVGYQAPPGDANDGTDWEFSSRPQIFGQGKTTPVGGPYNDNVDLILVLRGMNQSICEKINEEIGVSGIPIDSGELDVDRFDGDYVMGDNVDGCNPNCTTLSGSPFVQVASHIGCFEEANGGDYVYFHTLLAR